MKETNLLLLSIENLILVVLIWILTVTRHPYVNLVRFIPSFLDPFQFFKSRLNTIRIIIFKSHFCRIDIQHHLLTSILKNFFE